MTLKVQGIITPGRQLQSITSSGVIDAVDDNGIAVYQGATVADYRQVDIINAWRMLWNGIRDRDIMQQFAGVVYSGVDVEHIDKNSRITSATFGDFGDNDIFIGIGQLVVAEFFDYTVIIETVFQQLRDTALEDTYKAL
jgi:hypothetical protein